MSDEPLYCTWCGAEDWNCDCRRDKCGHAYCEVDYTHEWKEIGEGNARCVYCGLRALVQPSPEGGLRVVKAEEGGYTGAHEHSSLPPGSSDRGRDPF